MTSQVVLAYPTKGISIDLSSNGITIEHSYTNPLIVIPTPVMATPVGATFAFATAIIGFNTKPINIGFVANRFALTFTLTDGVGSLNFGGSGTTKYEKIVYLTNSADTKNSKFLYINDSPIAIQVESFRFRMVAGDKDLMLNCTLNCIAVDSSIEMG